MPATWIRSIVLIDVLLSLWADAGWAQALRVVGVIVESGGKHVKLAGCAVA